MQWIRVCEHFVERDLLLVDPDLVLCGIDVNLVLTSIQVLKGRMCLLLYSSYPTKSISLSAETNTLDCDMTRDADE